MPQLIFPTAPDGLFVDVLIGVDAQVAASFLATGQPIPPAIQARGVIDTGSDVSCAEASIFSQLGIPSLFATTSHTAAGGIRVNICRVRLSISDARNPGGPLLMRPSLLVMELANPLPTAQVLIGLDILLQCKLFLDGPAKQFTLEF